MKLKTATAILTILITTFSAKSQILIITADEYAEAMQPYIEWKSQKGLWCDIVKISNIGETHNELKNFVANYHKDNNNRYLLLVGDADKVPTHISYGVTNPNQYSAYSDAEYGYIYSTDYPPSVLVGRFSGESAEDIATQVERTIFYERDIDSTATWLSSTLGITNPSSSETGDNNETDHEHILNLNNILKDNGYNTATTNSKVTLRNAINNGCGLINYIGHGYTESWQTTGFSVSDVNNLTNTNQLPIIIAAGCQNGHFRLTTCLAESFLRGRDGNGKPIGAIGMLAFTTQIYWNPPMLGQDEFARILTTDSIGFTKSFGEVINAAYKNVIAKYKGSGADVACQWALFGDPSLLLRTKAPSTMNITHKKEITANEKNITIGCDTDYATATLWSNGTIIDSKQIENGNITLSTEGAKANESITLTITAQDKLTYQTDILVTQESGLKQTSNERNYEIYPNPSNGEITIKGKEKKTDIKVFNCSGQLVLTTEINCNTPFTLPLKSGTYFLYVENDKSTHSLLIRN
ncbi:MAG: T9SS type A sorting domain-containing protein [Muribaculaceae bacterium]|nr:T9SS type A sorting domain-containing protein [Muribaculaceae bacterium]